MSENSSGLSKFLVILEKVPGLVSLLFAILNSVEIVVH